MNFVDRKTYICYIIPENTAKERMVGNSSAELMVLMKIAELAVRCGIHPSDADALIDFDIDRDNGMAYRLSISYGASQSVPGIARFRKLMDMTATGVAWADNIRELEDKVEKALRLAPRARVR